MVMGVSGDGDGLIVAMMVRLLACKERQSTSSRTECRHERRVEDLQEVTVTCGDRGMRGGKG